MASEVQQRSTRQLAAVYEALRDDHSHPSADEIFLRVRKTLPRISLGTVYRNLQRLVEERKICVVLLGGRVARYDPMIAEHDHFICWQCGRIVDLVLEGDRQINLTSLVEQGFTIATQSLSIHGLCQQCNQHPMKKSQGNMEPGQRARRLRGKSRAALGKERKDKVYGV